MKKKYVVLIIIFSILLICSFIGLFSWHSENSGVKEIVRNEEEYLIEKENISYLEEQLFVDNPNTVGWIKVDGTSINYPVVQYSDNSYYLNHDFNRNNNSAGWIFMDSSNSLNDQNLVIYGHHRKDGSMFGSLDNLLNNHIEGNIQFITRNEVFTYRIFSIYKTSKNDIYRDKNFDNFNDIILTFKERSKYDYDVSIESPSQIITLSTCDNDNVHRIVLQGIKKIK